MKEDFPNDQAATLRRRANNVDTSNKKEEEPIDATSLPPRKETHRKKEQKRNYRFYFSLPHLLLGLFLLIVLAVLTGAVYYFQWL